jgi:hypothetical protein
MAPDVANYAPRRTPVGLVNLYSAESGIVLSTATPTIAMMMAAAQAMTNALIGIYSFSPPRVITYIKYGPGSLAVKKFAKKSGLLQRNARRPGNPAGEQALLTNSERPYAHVPCRIRRHRRDNVLSGATMTHAFAQANKLSKADQVALKHAIASCKSEAKAKKVKLVSRRQYVIDCVQALKDRPQVNVQEVLRNHPDLKGLPCPPRPDINARSAC